MFWFSPISLGLVVFTIACSSSPASTPDIGATVPAEVELRLAAIPTPTLLPTHTPAPTYTSYPTIVPLPTHTIAPPRTIPTTPTAKIPIHDPATVQWKTYANPEYSYQITVPRDWIYRENEHPDWIMFRSPSGLATAEVLVGSPTVSPGELLASMLAEARLENPAGVEVISPPAGVEVIFEPGDISTGDASASGAKQSYTRFRIIASDGSCAEDFRTTVVTTGSQSFWVVTSACEDVIETYGPTIDKILWSLDIDG